MLSYSLNYGHVLYCMDNETSTPAQWGQYWIQFIKDRATALGVLVYTTDMFDDAFEAEEAKHTPIIFDDAQHYMFADISPQMDLLSSRESNEAYLAAKMGAKVIFHVFNGGRGKSGYRDMVNPMHESNLQLRARAGKVWIVTVDNCFICHYNLDKA